MAYNLNESAFVNTKHYIVNGDGIHSEHKNLAEAKHYLNTGIGRKHSESFIVPHHIMKQGGFDFDNKSHWEPSNHAEHASNPNSSSGRPSPAPAPSNGPTPAPAPSNGPAPSPVRKENKTAGGKIGNAARLLQRGGEAWAGSADNTYQKMATHALVKIVAGIMGVAGKGVSKMTGMNFDSHITEGTRKTNNKDYTHYVVLHGKIASGWEYKDDAKDEIAHNMSDAHKSDAKVVAKVALSRHGLDADNNSHWHGGDLKESFYDDKSYTHYVMTRGKIESGHDSKEQAETHQSSRLAPHLRSDSRVVPREDLKKGHFDASNTDHWAKSSDLKESVISMIAEGDYYSFNDSLKNQLAEKAQFIIENFDKKRLLQAARNGTLAEMRDARGTQHHVWTWGQSGKKILFQGNKSESEKFRKEHTGYRKEDMFVSKSDEETIKEMRDAPDQSMYPLTRREVEKLLNTYERRGELNTNNIDDIEARSEDGMRRARWYAPDVKSDFKYDVEDDMFNPDHRPAALMPYDKRNIVTDDSATTPPDHEEEAEKQTPHRDFSGERNLYFHGVNNDGE